MSDNNQALTADIARYDWYQTIDLGNGLKTPGETGEATIKKLAMMDLPQDFTGKSVLDIGCNEGFFAFESERRGAEQVLALDKSPVAMEKFLLVKQIIGSNAGFLREDLTDLDHRKIGRFDVVFFLSVFHHLRYSFLSLDRVAELTRGFAVMEFVEAVPTSDAQPSALVRKLSRKGHLHMLPTRKFLLETLDRAGFQSIEILGEHRGHRIKEERDMPGFDEQRVLLKAHRRA